MNIIIDPCKFQKKEEKGAYILFYKVKSDNGDSYKKVVPLQANKEKNKDDFIYDYLELEEYIKTLNICDKEIYVAKLVKKIELEIKDVT